ncbi:MAG: glycosyltransferase family 39 protein [Isosphaeraceae bacterium]
MADRRSFAAVAMVAAMALLPGLGGASRLSYHEAHVAQAARELLEGAGGSPMVPTLDGRPWLEKPPMPAWLAAGVGWLCGGLDERAARLPSALAALALGLAVSSIAGRRFGTRAGLIAGLIQATTAWTVARGRLAEADIHLAALLAWTLAAFDRLRTPPEGGEGGPDPSAARWAFFGLLGLVGLVKGVGFGVALAMLVVVPTLLWDRDFTAIRRLARVPAGWLLALAINLAWPLAMAARYPGAARLWVDHIAGRFADRPQGFSGEPLWEYLPAPLALLLPWTPLAIVGIARSWGRARRETGRFGPDRLLIAWLVAPALAVSMARARNSHYLLPALAPSSIAAAVSVERLGHMLADRGWPWASLRRVAGTIFLGLGLAYGLGYSTLGPRFDRRGREWAFYEASGRRAPASEPLVLLYDDWDRLPYPTPFGPMPHDLAVRLFYLGRPATWRGSPEALRADPPAGPFAVIGRDRDRGDLARLGRVEELARGPQLRQPASKVDDRAFVLFRIAPARDDRVIRADFADSLEPGAPPGR